MLTLTAIKLIVLASALNLTQFSTAERTPSGDGDSGKAIKISREAENDPSLREESSINTDNSFNNYPAKMKWPVPEFTDNFLGLGSTRYIASVKLEDLLGFESKKGQAQAGNGTVLIGVQRPSYRLYGNPYVKGNIDLNMGASIFGLNNRGLVTVSYYLKSDDSYTRISSTLSVVGFSYKFIIPLRGL